MMTFMWDFSDESFRKLREVQKAGENEDYDNETRDYIGACFVGNIKFEMVINSTGFYYADALIKAVSTECGTEYWMHLEDGTPFDLFDYLDIPLPKRRTIGHFMAEFERRVIESLNGENKQYKRCATLPTLPYHWYYGMKYQPVIVREAIY